MTGNHSTLYGIDYSAVNTGRVCDWVHEYCSEVADDFLDNSPEISPGTIPRTAPSLSDPGEQHIVLILMIF